MRWQVPHSNVRSSKPRAPEDIRTNPILCLQVGHIGRSAMEDKLRIAFYPGEKRYGRAARLVCTVDDSPSEFR
jgi:hypothetical protein